MLTSILRLKTSRPLHEEIAGGRSVVTNWSATRVFDIGRKILISERFHNRSSTALTTHKDVVESLRFATEMTLAEHYKTYFGD